MPFTSAQGSSHLLVLAPGPRVTGLARVSNKYPVRPDKLRWRGSLNGVLRLVFDVSDIPVFEQCGILLAAAQKHPFNHAVAGTLCAV